MKIDETTVEAVSSEEFKNIAFRVDQKMAQIIFRDKLYSAEGKLRVIAQEYMANARDAHRAAGKSDTPIDVTLPSSLSPEFVVRDYGNGIPKNVVEDIFVVYGASTKKKSNLENGGYGIGAKCAFSYVNAFSVTTTVQGTRYIYAASIDSDGMNQFTLMDTGPATGPDGTEIRVPIKSSDISMFNVWVKEITHYWTPRPNFTNGEVSYRTTTPELTGDRWELYRGTSPCAYRVIHPGVTVVVDDIPYIVTSDQARAIDDVGKDADDNLLPNAGLFDRLFRLLVRTNRCLIMHFRGGEVVIPPQRETIDLTARTKEALTEAVDRFTKYAVDTAMEQVAAAVSPLERVALSLKDTIELEIARTFPGVIHDNCNLAGKEFNVEDAGFRLYTARFSRNIFRDLHQKASTSLKHMVEPNHGQRIVVDMKGRKMSEGDLKRLIRSECRLEAGNLFIVAIYDMAAFKTVTGVDIDTLDRVARYESCERDDKPRLPRRGCGGYFFIREMTASFSHYSGDISVENNRRKVDELPTGAIFIDMTKNDKFYKGKPITDSELGQLMLLYGYLTKDGGLYAPPVYGWEERFEDEHSPSDYRFLEDAILEAIEAAVELPDHRKTKLALNGAHAYKVSAKWPSMGSTDWVDTLCKRLGYNDLFASLLTHVIKLENSEKGESMKESRKMVEKLWKLIDPETVVAIDEALEAAVRRLYDARTEFMGWAYSNPLMPVFLSLQSQDVNVYARENGHEGRLSFADLICESLKDHKPINPMFKA